MPDVLFALAGVSRAAELGQPRAGHRGRAQRPPPPCARAAPRQPGGAEPHAPHAPGRARAGPAAVPEAQGNASSCLMSAILSQNSFCSPVPFSIRFDPFPPPSLFPPRPFFPFFLPHVWESGDCSLVVSHTKIQKKLDSPGKDLWQGGKGKMYCLEYLDEWVKLPKHLVLF